MRNRPEHLADERQRGAVASEYAVLLSIIAASLVLAVGVLSEAVTAVVNAAAGVIN